MADSAPRPDAGDGQVPNENSLHSIIRDPGSSRPAGGIPLASDIERR